MEDFETSQVCMQCIWMDVDVVFPWTRVDSGLSVFLLGWHIICTTACLSALQLQEFLAFFLFAF